MLGRIGNAGEAAKLLCIQRRDGQMGHTGTMSEIQETEVDTAEDHAKLSTFMKVSIAILSVVTVLSISLLFIGDFEGRFERVFSTLTLFAIFVLLTMFDTRRDRRDDWYAPLALVANTYILGLLLIVIWVTPYDPFTLQMSITWQSIYVIVVTRVVVWGIEQLFRRGEGAYTSLARWSQVTGILVLLTLVLFTAPLGFTAFLVDVPEMYWRFAVAALILAGLGIAVTLLLSWYFRSQEKQLRKAAEPVVAAPAATATAHATAQPVAPEPELLPWPTFADGSPLPMQADGQPDFSAVTQAQPPHQS